MTTGRKLAELEERLEARLAEIETTVDTLERALNEQAERIDDVIYTAERRLAWGTSLERSRANAHLNERRSNTDEQVPQAANRPGAAQAAQAGHREQALHRRRAVVRYRYC